MNKTCLLQACSNPLTPTQIERGFQFCSLRCANIHAKVYSSKEAPEKNVPEAALAITISDLLFKGYEVWANVKSNSSYPSLIVKLANDETISMEVRSGQIRPSGTLAWNKFEKDLNTCYAVVIGREVHYAPPLGEFENEGEKK